MEDNKKPGQRDISDLKARLGLKKAAPPAAAVPNTTPARGQQSIPTPVSSSGSGSGSGPTSSPPLPSPFGRPEPPPQPAAPAAPPDPRRDPFAQQQAANLAAFYGVGQVLPGSSDSVAAGPLSKPKPWGRLLLLAAVGAVVFGVGTSCGAIYHQRVDFNKTIDQASQIKEEVDRMGKQLNSIKDTINNSKATVSGSGIDPEMTAALGGLDLKKPDTQKLFHTNYAHLEDVAIDRLFNYYNHTIQLYDDIRVHASRTENDKDAITRYLAANKDQGKSDKNYGVILEAQGGLQLAHFVEMGTPVCPEAGKTDCAPNEWKGFKYRVDAGGAWGERPLKGAPNAIIMPLQQTPLFKQVASGNPDFLAVKDYARRMSNIRALITGLVAEEKEVDKDMTRAATRAKVFTF